MTYAQAIRRIGILTAAILLTTSIGVTPLYAVDSDNPAPHADNAAKKKTDQKTSKAKVQKPEETTGRSAPAPYMPEPPHGSGY